MGDFNFKVDLMDGAASEFKSVLNFHRLQQHVSGSTHEDGHTLDLVISHADADLVLDMHVEDLGISDHSVVSFKLCGKRPPLPRKQLNYRAFRGIDLTQLQHDIAQSALSDASSDASLVNTYNTVLSPLRDKHAPAKQKTVIMRPNTPWYNDEVDDAICARRQLERAWKKSGLVIHHQIFRHQCTVVMNTIRRVKRAYYIPAVSDAGSDQRALFGIVKSLMHKKNDLPLPVHDSPAQLAEKFGAFFMDKIARIRSTLDAKRPGAAQPAQHLGESPFWTPLCLPQCRRSPRLLKQRLQNHAAWILSPRGFKGLPWLTCSCNRQHCESVPVKR